MDGREPGGQEPGGPARAAGRPDGGQPPTDEAPGTDTGTGTGTGGLAPLPQDGVGSVAVGTAAWLVALVVMLPFTDDLRADGHLWWIATAACGFGLGLLGLVIVIRHRHRLRGTQHAASTPED